MTSSDKRSHWRDLASQLGAPVPEENESTDCRVDENAPDRGSCGLNCCRSDGREKRNRRAPPPVKRDPSHWLGLASDLGLELPSAERDAQRDRVCRFRVRRCRRSKPARTTRTCSPKRRTTPLPLNRMTPSAAEEMLDEIQPAEETVVSEEVTDGEELGSATQATGRFSAGPTTSPNPPAWPKTPNCSTPARRFAARGGRAVGRKPGRRKRRRRRRRPFLKREGDEARRRPSRSRRPPPQPSRRRSNPHSPRCTPFRGATNGTGTGGSRSAGGSEVEPAETIVAGTVVRRR